MRAKSMATLPEILNAFGFHYDAPTKKTKPEAFTEVWVDQWATKAENGFARIAVKEGDESFDAYRFTPNGTLAWQITGIQFTSVPPAVIQAVVSQLKASLKEAA